MKAADASQLRFTAPLVVSFAVMMAYQVASRATRDALFLSNFPARALPLMVIAAAVLSIAGAIGVARILSRLGPIRVIPGIFALSGLVTLGEWLLVTRQPAVAAVLVYLHVAAIGPVLVSGFWSLLNERFDPRGARRVIGRITAIGTLGGLLGGLLAERSATWFGLSGTLALLALMQGACAWSLHADGSHEESPTQVAPDPAGFSVTAAFQRLAVTPYLRNLALLLLGSSVSAALLDYVFKAQTAGAMPAGLGMLRWFAAFYAIVSMLTFAIQVLLSRAAFERVGLAPSIGALPGAVVVGGVAASLVPGPWSVGFARGLEAVLRGSLFRSGYELLYMPIPAAEKRATKPIVDIGCDRLGDMIGAGLVALVLTVPASAPASTSMLIGIAVAVALATMVLVARLQRGYVSSLEAGLRARALQLDSIELPDWSMDRSLEETMTLRVFSPRDAGGTGAGLHSGALPVPAGAASAILQDDDLTRTLKALRSGDALRVRAELAAGTPLDPGVVPQVIALLAWDEVSRDARRALRAVATNHVGQFVDALLDPETDFSVRRRIPPVLMAARTARAVEGLVSGLTDTRFEVRKRCATALADLLAADTSLSVDADTVFEAVRRETRVGRTVWSSQRLLEQIDDESPEGFVDEFVRQRASRSLEHVFTLLALVLPREPLRIAFSGLHAGNPALRGISLEYLESILPASVREDLWPHLETASPSSHKPEGPARQRAEVLDDLLRSHRSIRIDLEQLRRDQPDNADPTKQ